MPPIPLQLPTGSTIGREGQDAYARLINGYVEQIDRDGKSTFALYGAPGLTRWDTGSFSGAERGMIALDDTHLIAILGTQAVKFDTSGNGTVIGTIGDTGRVIMALDRENPRTIAVITQTGLYYLISGGNTVTAQPQTFSMTASLAVGGVLTVTAFGSPVETLGIGAEVSAVTAAFTVSSLGTGAGGAGTYNVSDATTILSSQTMNVTQSSVNFTIVASLTGGVLTVTSVQAGYSLAVGASITGGISAVNLTGLGTGLGGTGTYYLSDITDVLQTSATFTFTTGSNLPTPCAVTYLAGCFLYTIPDGRVFCSAIDDGTTISAAGYSTANSNPYGARRAYAYNGYLYVFCEQDTEIWRADDALANYPFPYSNTNSTINIGIGAPFSLAELDEGLAWVDNKGIVRYSVQGGAQRISTHTVERAIAALSPSDRAQIVGFPVVWEGHSCYVISSTQWTWFYDLRSNPPCWFERASDGVSPARWQASSAIYFNGVYILGDKDTGKLYYLNNNEYDEAGNTLTLQIWCGVSHRFPGHMIVDKLAIDAITGVGLASGASSDVTPMMTIDHSDDGGNTFTGSRQVSLGTNAAYTTTIETYCWGRVTEKGRIWRLSVSARVLKAILRAELLARPIRG